MNKSELHCETLPIGTILRSPKQKYRVEEVLGKGGFGITYKVSAEVMVGNIPVHTFFCVKEHFVADCCERDGKDTVNVSKAASGKYSESLDCFKSEAKRLKSLSGRSKGLVRVNEVFEANNTAYYVMEFLEGESLREKVRRIDSLAEEDAIKTISEIGCAVTFLHSEQITHLDIKPDNIMLHKDRLTNETIPVLIDFGLAKHYTKKGNPTSAIKVLGCSDGYSPIEQYVGIDRFSPEADVYALAATMMFLLTGKDPPVASEMSAEHIEEYLGNAVSQQTRAAISKAMRKEKRERTQSVNDFISELNALEENGKSEQDTNKTLTVAATKPSKKKRLPYFVAAAVCAVIGYLCVGLFDNVVSDDIQADAPIEIVENTPKDTVEADMDMQTEEIANDNVKAETTSEQKKQMTSFMALADKCCDKAENRSGNEAMIQELLDAKYYYYDKAQTIYRQLYGKDIERNERIDKLVKREYEYWIKKGNSVGKSKRNYAIKKKYYQNAYKLVNSERIKSYIDWLDSKIKK